jgi:hypothetical protein
MLCTVKQSQTVASLPSDYSTRPALETDAKSIYRVIYEYDVSILGYSDFAKDDLLELFREEHFNIPLDSCLVMDEEGRAVGYTMIWAREPR